MTRPMWTGCLLVLAVFLGAHRVRAEAPTSVALKPQVFDGIAAAAHEGWVVVVQGKPSRRLARPARSRSPRASASSTARDDVAAGPDRRPYPRVAPSL